MKLGILGTGMIVREFLPWLTGADSPFTVQCICSTQRSAEAAGELCEQYGIPQHTTNYFELLQDVDVVYLAVPNNQHARYAKVAIEAGKHVIVEKPMAINALQAEELANLARRRKVFLFEAMTTQYLENYNKIRELLPRVGKVKQTRAVALSRYRTHDKKVVEVALYAYTLYCRTKPEGHRKRSSSFTGSHLSSSRRQTVLAH